MKRWDVIVIGGGVIGLSLAWELRSRNASVLLVERGALGREASWAAGGMLAWCDPHLPEATRRLARLSQRLYGDFVRGIEEASGLSADLRRVGTILVDEGTPGNFVAQCRELDASELARVEPALRRWSETHLANGHWKSLQIWPEWSVDPRGLISALIAGCVARGVEMVTESIVSRILVTDERATGVATANGNYMSGAVVNGAGAWASAIECGLGISPSPTRPIKGQMLALRPRREVLRHVIRTPDVYMIPRSDGRIVVGATIEEAGFDTQNDPAAIERLRAAAVNLVPELENSLVHETWAGLRPAPPDDMPILGDTALPGYFVATGHFRDGILLAPATARVVAAMVVGETAEIDFKEMSPKRFG